MNGWHKYPGFRIVVPLILGIVCAVELKISSTLLFWASSVLVLLLMSSFYFSTYKNRNFIGGLVCVLLFFVGGQLTISKTEKYQSIHFSKGIDNIDYFVAKIIESPSEKSQSIKAVLRITGGFGETNYQCSGTVIAYFMKCKLANDLAYGDQVLLKNKLQPIVGTRNPNQFDYQNYLDLNQINYQLVLHSDSWKKIQSNTGNKIIAFSQKMRKKLHTSLRDNGVEGNQLKVASALLLGYREKLDKDLIKSYSSAGAMHVLAVSGLHVGILYLLLSNLFKVFSKWKASKYVTAILLIFLLWFYALMTGLSASVMRSSTMFTFIIIGEKLLKRSACIYNTLSVSAIILIIIDPYVVYQVGFQLSYAAVLGIVYLQPKIYRMFYISQPFLQKIWAITCVSIAAQIATFPLSLHYFHQFPVYFFISNLIVIPAAIGIFYLGVILFISASFGGFSLVVGKVLNGLLILLNEAVFFTEGLSYSLIEEIALTVLETYWLYSIILSCLFLMYYRKLKLVYLTLFLCLGFVSFQLYDQYASTQQERITFYSIKNETAFEFVKGKRVYFVRSKALDKDWSKLLFNVNNNWNTHNITSKIMFDIDSLETNYQDDYLFLKKGIFQFNSITVLVLNKENYLFKGADYVLLSETNLKLFKQFNTSSNADYLIFDSSIPAYKVTYYTRFIDTNKTKLISLARKYYSVEL